MTLEKFSPVKLRLNVKIFLKRAHFTNEQVKGKETKILLLNKLQVMPMLRKPKLSSIKNYVCVNT